MAGKGDKWRKNVDLVRYRENFDKIFRKTEESLTSEELEKFKNDRDSMSFSEFQKFVRK